MKTHNQPISDITIANKACEVLSGLQLDKYPMEDIREILNKAVDINHMQLILRDYQKERGIYQEPLLKDTKTNEIKGGDNLV